MGKDRLMTKEESEDFKKMILEKRKQTPKEKKEEYLRKRLTWTEDELERCIVNK